MKPWIVVVARDCVQAERHVEPGANPFATVDGARLDRLNDLPARYDHHHGAHPPQHLGARPCHAVAQPFEILQRGNFAGKPSAHLTTRAGAKQRLDVELPVERVPQVLTTAVLDPRKQLICGKAEGDGREEMQSLRLVLEVAFVGMIHVCDAGTYCVKSFEWANERPGQKNFDFDTATSCGADCLREPNCAWVKARQTCGPVGHHLELSYSLGDCRRGKAQGCTRNQ